jgi:hypothetical protein
MRVRVDDVRRRGGLGSVRDHRSTLGCDPGSRDHHRAFPGACGDRRGRGSCRQARPLRLARRRTDPPPILARVDLRRRPAPRGDPQRVHQPGCGRGRRPPRRVPGCPPKVHGNQLARRNGRHDRQRYLVPPAHLEPHEPPRAEPLPTPVHRLRTGFLARLVARLGGHRRSARPHAGSRPHASVGGGRL